MTRTHTRTRPSSWVRLLAAIAGLAVVAAGVLTASPASAEIGGLYVVINKHSHMCIDVAYGSLDDSARVQQYDCYGGPPVTWRYDFFRIDDDHAYFNIVNLHSGKCLDVPY